MGLDQRPTQRAPWAFSCQARRADTTKNYWRADRNSERQLGAFLGALAILILCRPLLAHPGHAAIQTAPLPAWRLADGRVLSAYLLKAQDGRAWFVDESDQTVIVPLADLDEAGRQAVQRTTSRLRIVNGARPAAGGSLAMTLTGLLVADAPAVAGPMPDAARVFQKFERVKTRWDDRFLYVESNGLPDHAMMKGITSWQQQVPLPQPYFGDNAWRIPLNPVPAEAPAMIEGRFLRGAIAVAANGIPIFNPQNNRGEISQEIGELDEWGGHCGRADDYHYHIVPMHLQKVVGKGMPLAYALDGYPIFGDTEPDGSQVGKLDECHGHTTSIGYHYHAAMKYPYVIGGFHGQVAERGGQVDPQPRANPLRPALPPMRGATITGFKSTGKDQNELTYEISGRKGYVRYELNADASYTFAFEDPDGRKREQNFPPRRGNAPPPTDDNRSAPGDVARLLADAPAGIKSASPAGGSQKKESSFMLSSPEVADGGALPKEFTGDGAAATLPLEWSNPPAGTKSYALIMHHIPGPGDVKWYWIVYNIPADVHSLPKNARGVGTLGNNSVNGRTGYAPPHSKGPGAKTYILTLYALSSEPQLTVPPAQVDRATLLAAIKDRTLAAAELKVTYDRTAVIAAGGNAQPVPAKADGPGNGPAPGTEPPPGKGPPGGIHLFPREVEEKLNLTADQRSRIDVLQKETGEKLNKILTPEQAKVLQESRPPRREPPPP